MIYCRPFFPWKCSKQWAYILWPSKVLPFVKFTVRPTIKRRYEENAVIEEERSLLKVYSSKCYRWISLSAYFMAREVARAPTATKGRTNERTEKKNRVILLQYILYYIIFTFNVQFYSYNVIWNEDDFYIHFASACSHVEINVRRSKEKEMLKMRQAQTVRLITLSAV